MGTKLVQLYSQLEVVSYLGGASIQSYFGPAYIYPPPCTGACFLLMILWGEICDFYDEIVAVTCVLQGYQLVVIMLSLLLCL